jgi:hypothetical protein
VSQNLKISYCTTCKGRAHHVQETLIANLAAEADNDNVEFVLLDYESNDGLEQWVRERLSAEIERGRVVYARHAPAPHFKMAHAKNMSHRLASGDILVNVDGDNIIAHDFSRWIRTCFERGENKVACPRNLTVTGYILQRVLNKHLGLPRPIDGLCGRIAVARATFYEIGGYDEKFVGWGSDDFDFMLRARDAGATLVPIPAASWGSTIAHDKLSRLENFSAQERKVAQANLETPTLFEVSSRVSRILMRRDPIANKGKMFGAGRVSLNWGPFFEFPQDGIAEKAGGAVSARRDPDPSYPQSTAADPY